MAGVAKQIIGSFEDIGKDIVREVAKVPKDIAGKALESLGTAGAKQQGLQAASPKAPEPQGALKELDQTNDKKVKEAIARSALVQLAGKKKQKEPSVWERIQQETEQKKQLSAQQQVQAAQAQLQTVSAKRPRGDLYGMKAKKASAEMSRNVRQD